ncbi:hypothetical protein [Tunturiibacter lichenicola]|uniref:bestrophin-like domain n=1 Tax=Tunturiibacter lichenicola TaxID=2051959 RepID=UPI003D9BFD0E
MSSVAVSSIVFALIFGGSLVGMALRWALPVEHLGQDAKDTMRLAIGLVATMTGLVLGMLVSSAKSYYDGQKNKVSEMSSEVILLNNSLAVFGPDADQIRFYARQTVEAAIDRIWPKDKSSLSQLMPKENDVFISAQLQSLVPKNEMQASAKAQAVALLQNLRKSNWLMFLESEQASIPPLLLVVVTSWLVIIFISFGIFAPPNPTVISTLIICALAASGAIFIILEMYSPFSGLLRISSAAVRDALNQLSAAR